jgi:hypothetical protein
MPAWIYLRSEMSECDFYIHPVVGCGLDGWSHPLTASSGICAQMNCVDIISAPRPPQGVAVRKVSLDGKPSRFPPVF